MASQTISWRPFARFSAASVLVLGILAYLSGFYNSGWVVFVLFILMPALGLVALAFRYVGGEIGRFGRSVRAVIFGFIAMIYLVSNLTYPEPGSLAVAPWVLFSAWLILAFTNLYLALRTQGTIDGSS